MRVLFIVILRIREQLHIGIILIAINSLIGALVCVIKAIPF